MYVYKCILFAHRDPSVHVYTVILDASFYSWPAVGDDAGIWMSKSIYVCVYLCFYVFIYVCVYLSIYLSCIYMHTHTHSKTVHTHTLSLSLSLPLSLSVSLSLARSLSLPPSLPLSRALSLARSLSLPRCGTMQHPPLSVATPTPKRPVRHLAHELAQRLLLPS